VFSKLLAMIWDDKKRAIIGWFAGAAAFVIGGIWTVIAFVIDHPAAKAPTGSSPTVVIAPGTTQQNYMAGLSRPGRIVAKHEGSVDPLRENFKPGDDGFQHMRMSPMESVGSWRIRNPKEGKIPYVFAIEPQDLTAAQQYGWRLKMRVKLNEKLANDAGAHINFDTNSRRYDVNIVPAFPTDPNDTEVSVRLNDEVRKADAIYPSGKTVRVRGGVFHTVVLAFDPTDRSATLFVDDEFVQGGYKGHTSYTNPNEWNVPVFMFGDSNAEADFQLAQFEILQ